MKTKIVVLILFSTLICLAQAGNQSSDSARPANPEAKVESNATPACPCCKAMSENTDKRAACCHHDSATKEDKPAMSCGGDKDAVSCCGNKDMKGCCGDKQPMSCMKHSHH
jgi:hypothetical protein